MSGNTFLILAAIALVIIFVSTLTREIGRQFSSSERSFPFFPMRVMTACFCEQDISPLTKHSLTHLVKLSLIKFQNVL